MVEFASRPTPTDQGEEYGENTIDEMTPDPPQEIKQVRIHILHTGPELIRISRVEYLDERGNQARHGLEEHPWWANEEIAEKELVARFTEYLNWMGHRSGRIEIVDIQSAGAKE